MATLKGTISLGDWSRGRKSVWRGHKKKPEAEGAAQKRKKQVDGKRAARGSGGPLNRDRIGPQNMCEEAATLEREGAGLTAGGRDRVFSRVWRCRPRFQLSRSDGQSSDAA